MHTFNADFYVATATVIPVLYLALTLQGRTYQDIMTRWRAGNREAPWKFWPQVRVVASAFIGIFGGGFVLFGVYGEYLALQALYAQHATPATRRTVLDASLLLLAIVAIGPAYALLSAFFGSLYDDYRAAMKGKLGVLLKRLEPEPTSSHQLAAQSAAARAAPTKPNDDEPPVSAAD